jgi:hypothetical protein
MSARFGRNKRRAARAELAVLQKNIDYLQRRQDNHDRQIYDLVEFEKRVTEIVGHLCIIHKVPYFAGTVDSLGHDVKFTTRRMSGPHSNSTHSSKIETLRVMAVGVIKGSLGEMSHISATINGVRSYCISDAAITNTPFEILCGQIADALSIVLAEALQEKEVNDELALYSNHHDGA